MHQDFFYEMLKYKPLLYKKILKEFSQESKKYEEDFFENSSDFLFSKNAEKQNLVFLLENPKIKQYLSKAKNDFSWDYTHEEKRLTLLSKKELEKLALYFGTSIHAQEIAHTVHKEKLLPLKNDLGDELYVYALERGQYMLLQLADILSKFDKDLALVERVKLHGQVALKIITSSWSDKEKEKLPLLIQKESQMEKDGFKFSENELHAIYFALKKILIKEITSEWQQCLD